MYDDTLSLRGSHDVPLTAWSTSASWSKAPTSGSTIGTPQSPFSTNPSTIKAGSRASSIAASWKRRKPWFHVTSFTLSVVCKLLTVHHSPPPLRPYQTSTAPSTVSLIKSAPVMKPLKVYGDIIGSHLCKVVLVMKELGLPYVLKILDHSTADRDPCAPTALTKGIPALDDPNTGLTLWESGAIVEYIEETYDKENMLRYNTFPEIWQQKQWSWHQTGGHESILGRRAFISVHDTYDAIIRGNLATIESHLSFTGNLYLVGDRITYADIMYIAFQEATRTTLHDISSDDFDVEWRKTWPRSYDWHQRLLQRHTVREFFKERAKIISERGWID